MAKPTPKDTISVKEHAQRREKVLASLKGSAAVVFSGEGSPPLFGKWRADANFVYLTGLSNEPGAAVLFDPTNEDPKRRIILFLKPVDPEAERWDGYRDRISSALKERTGFQTIFRNTTLPRFLTAAARRAKKVACLHTFAVYPAPVTPDLAVYRQLSERIAGLSIEDRTEILPMMRAVKSPAELRLMRKAAEATAEGYRRALRVIRPGVTEAQIAEALEGGYRAMGGSGSSYNPIVGSGLNGTVLHYMDNDATTEEGDLVVIDSAADYSGYAADVTRTFPVSGTFTQEQREIYELVLAAQTAAIKTARAGATMTVVEAAARKVIEKAGHGDAFIHGVGHQLGLEVHDITPDGPLRAGMVVTIEPGVYFPDRKLGVRIEDDVLITARGNENLTAMIPRTVKEIEQAMRA